MLGKFEFTVSRADNGYILIIPPEPQMKIVGLPQLLRMYQPPAEGDEWKKNGDDAEILNPPGVQVLIFANREDLLAAIDTILLEQEVKDS